MDVAQNIAQPETQWRWRLLVWALITVAFTSWSIQYSYRHGRLIAAPGYDDVGYLCEGVERLDEFYEHGWKGLIRSCFDKPPHAPFSSVMATVSLGLFGMHEWAPYAANGIIVFVLIAFTEWLLAGAALWLRVVGLVLVLSPPLSQMAIIEFRPDIAVGLVSAMAVLMAVTRSLTESRWRYTLAVGGLFGLAFLIKPTMSVMTFGLWGLSLSLGMCCDWYLYRPAWRKLFARYGAVALVTVLIASPYFALNGKHTARYIYTNIFGQEAATWHTPGTQKEHLLFYVSGQGAVQMVDNTYWVLVTLNLLGAACILLRRRRDEIVRTAALALCMIAAVTVPTISQCKHGFYGVSFYVLVIFGAVLSLRQIYLTSPVLGRSGRCAFSLILLGVTAFSLWQYPHGPKLGTVGDSRSSSSRKTCADIAAALVEHRPFENAVVFSAVEAQYANWHTLMWVTRKDGHKFTFVDMPLGSNLSQYRDEIVKADLVLAFETETPITRFASERQASSILAMVRGMPNYSEVASFPSYGGIVYHLFKKRSDFTAWKEKKGLGDIEGPYPQWNLPRVRWGVGKESQLRFETKTDEPLSLSLSCRTDIAGQVITVLCDGKQIHSQPLPAGAAFSSIDVRLPALERGEHELTLQYAVADSRSDPRALAVLFERLQLLPAPR